MGAAFFIVLDNKEPGFDTFMNGKFLAAEHKGLAKAAAAADLRVLEEYVSQAPEDAVAMAEELGASLDIGDVAKEQWYMPEEGLNWVNRVMRHLGENPTLVKNIEGVTSDLRELEALLHKAKGIGAKWHLEVDF